MTEYSFSNSPLAIAILTQISQAIDDIVAWNVDVKTADDYCTLSEGMKTLAATSMLLEAIGEGIKRVDRLTQGELLPLRPEIPWADVMSMRNHIAHGYFDIDYALIYDTVKNDLAPLKTAVDALMAVLQKTDNNI